MFGRTLTCLATLLAFLCLVRAAAAEKISLVELNRRLSAELRASAPNAVAAFDEAMRIQATTAAEPSPMERLAWQVSAS